MLTAALSALAALSVLPAALTAEAEMRSAEVVPAKATSSAGEGTPEVDRKTERSSLEKLALEKLTLEKLAPKKPPPEKPAPVQKPTPERERVTDQNPDKKNPKRVVTAGATSTPTLPGPVRKPPTKRQQTNAPPAAAKPAPRDNRLLLSVPRLGLENVLVGDSPGQAYLDREGIMHLSGTGFPYQGGSNTYIAGHADYAASRIPSIFRNLQSLRQGDHIILRDATGKTYDYRVYKRFVVTPYDVWVTKPVAGKQIVSLQTCFPAPTFHKRLIVRGELVS